MNRATAMNARERRRSIVTASLRWVMVFERDGELHAALVKTDRGPNWLSNGLSLTIR